MPTIGLNLRVTTDSNQGGRKYMEDVISVQFEKGLSGEEIEFAYFAVFDGHGGPEAAKFAKECLLDEIKKHKGFWTDDDVQVMRAIRDAFISSHKLMWKAVGSWPRTHSGLPSTAGTTASVVIIRNSKMYVAHVGDSTIVMGSRDKNSDSGLSHVITTDHKPESPEEKQRIESCGGSVVAKAGVQRVVWHRPKRDHKGPIRRSTQIDHIPFLAVARSLGDLWSYNSQRDTFVVSPEPDVCMYKLDYRRHRCIILASDGLWNVVKAYEAVDYVMGVEKIKETSGDENVKKPASGLVEKALKRWSYYNYRADNTSVIVVILDPPGSPRPPLSRAPSDTSSTASTMDLSEEDAKDLDFEDEDEEPIRLELENQRISVDSPSVGSSPLTECNKVTDNHFNCKKLWKPAVRKPIYKGTRPFTPGSAPPRLAAARRLCKVRPKFQKMARLHGARNSPGIKTPKINSPAPSESSSPQDARGSPVLKTPVVRADSEPTTSGCEEPELVTAVARRLDGTLKEGLSMTPGRMGIDIGCPQNATTPCSPIKVNVAQNADLNSPCIGMVSPIWPNSLDLSLDMDVAAEVSLETSSAQTTCIHTDTDGKTSDEENLDKPSCTSCRTPNKIGVKRKANFSPTQSPMKHLRISSPHKTRGQIMNLRARSKTPKSKE